MQKETERAGHRIARRTGVRPRVRHLQGLLSDVFLKVPFAM